MSKQQIPQTSTAALMTGEHSTDFSGEIEGMPEFPEDGSHLDAFVASDADADAAVEHGVIDAQEWGDQADAVEAGETQIDKEAFWVVFQTGFAMPGMFSPMFAPLGIQEAEMPAGRAASDAVYSLLEIYYPRALQPGSETLAHLLIAGPFIIGKIMVVRAVVNEARRPKMPEPPKPANENAQPQPDTRAAVKDTMAWMDAENAA